MIEGHSQRERDFYKRQKEDMGEDLPIELCPMCARPKNTPGQMLDDSYSVFPCPHPFHDDAE
jgi:hypothetical protein